MATDLHLTRRAFVQAASGTLAGVATAGGAEARAVTTPPTASSAWGQPWRPQAPKRLSAATRELARRAISGEHGKAMQPASFAISPAQGRGLTPNGRYALAAKLVAEQAPLRILPGELIVGSATLAEAALHATPLAGCSSVSHTTLGFHRVLEIGYAGLREQIEERLARGWPDAPAAPAPSDASSSAAFTASPNAATYLEAEAKAGYGAWPLTVECRARLDSPAGYNILVAHLPKENARHWELFSEAGSGKFSVYAPGLKPDTLISPCVITDGKWHHVAMTCTGKVLRLLVDGRQVAEAAVAVGATADPSVGPIWVGAYPPGGLGCTGVIEQVAISSTIRESSVGSQQISPADTHTIACWGASGGNNGRWADASAGDNPLYRVPQHPADPRRDLLESMRACLDAADIWHRRHLEALTRLADASNGSERDTWLTVRTALAEVPARRPRTFHQAVQSLWFMYAFQRLMGTWSGIGRIDQMLGPYLRDDLAAGRITLDQAREILAHFWIKGCEWTGAKSSFGGSGDAQFYQNIILAGCDADGRDATNEVTYLVLDIVEELHISDFPIAVRLSPRSPDKLVRRIAEVQRHGGGIVAVYNEDVVIDGLVKFGYALEEARGFTNDGCWEVLIPGRTTFSYVPFDMLALLQQTLGLEDPAATPAFADFEALYAAFLEHVARYVNHHHHMADTWALGGHPTPLVSLFVEDCVERGRSYFDRGSRYTVLAPHAGGMADTANSLEVIRKLVFEDGFITLPELTAVLREDWKGREPLRRLVHSRFEFYGNDTPASDAMMRRVFEDYASLVEQVREREGVKRPAGISTFGREIGWARPGGTRKATADGHREGEVLATNCSPSPGTDRKGPTAVLRSYCGLDFTRTPNGATLELKVHPDSVRGPEGVDALVALLRGFVRLGGWFLHVDVVDSAMLVDAQQHPEKYPNLSVRVAGWSARFATLDRQWQDMVIGRTQQVC